VARVVIRSGEPTSEPPGESHRLRQQLHRRKRDFAEFVGGETLLALQAASDDIAFVRFARRDDLRFVVGANGAAHSPLLD